jgi:hypothetical protein
MGCGIGWGSSPSDGPLYILDGHATEYGKSPLVVSDAVGSGSVSVALRVRLDPGSSDHPLRTILPRGWAGGDPMSGAVATETDVSVRIAAVRSSVHVQNAHCGQLAWFHPSNGTLGDLRRPRPSRKAAPRSGGVRLRAALGSMNGVTVVRVYHD